MYCTVCSYLIFAREFVSKPRQTPNHCDKCNLWKSSMEEQFWWNFILISDRSLPRCYYNVLLWYFCTLIDSGRCGGAQATWPRQQQAVLTDQVRTDQAGERSITMRQCAITMCNTSNKHSTGNRTKLHLKYIVWADVQKSLFINMLLLGCVGGRGGWKWL